MPRAGYLFGLKVRVVPFSLRYRSALPDSGGMEHLKLKINDLLRLLE